MKDFFSKCDQIFKFLVCLMENFIFFVVETKS